MWALMGALSMPATEMSSGTEFAEAAQDAYGYVVVERDQSGWLVFECLVDGCMPIAEG